MTRPGKDNLISTTPRIPAAALLVATLLSAGLLQAVTLRVYEDARHDQAKQLQLLNSAYETAIPRTLAGLKDTHFKDGKEKTQQRIERDLKRADRIESIVGNLTRPQSAALVAMIDQYAQAQTGYRTRRRDFKLSADRGRQASCEELTSP